MARMTPPKSPMLKSPMPKSPMVCEKYETGCMWHLYGLFNLRQGHSNKKLLSHSRHLKRLDDGNFKAKLDLLSKVDEKCQITDDRMNNKTQTVDTDMASKRNLKGEELSTGLQMNKKIAIDEVKHMQSDSEFVGHSPKNNGKARKTRQRSQDIPLHSLKNETENRRPSNSIPVDKPSTKLNSAALPEEFSKDVHTKNRSGCGCKNITSVKHDQLSEIKLLPVQMNAAEAIINQKFIDGVNHQSKQLSDALEILNSNKELFMKLLQDPNSLLGRHIEDLRESQARKHQSKSLCEANISDYWASKARQSEGPSGIHKLKSRDIYPSQESGDSECSERIIVLKPGPPSLQNSAESISERLTNFSFSRIKRKLRHAIGVSRNEQGSKSIDYPHISHFQGSEVDCNGKGVETVRRHSSSTTNADSGGVTKSSFDIKKRDNIGKVKECELSIGHEAASTSGNGLGNSNISLVSQSKRKESETSVEDRKHLSELLDNGNKDKNYFERQALKTWGRVTSFPEYNFLPTRSLVRDWENRFVIEQIRSSPYSNCQMVYENKWRLQKERKTSNSSPLRQEVEDLPDNKKLDNKLQVSETQTNMSDYPLTDIKMQGPKGCVQILENNNIVHQGETNSLEVPSESESIDKVATREANDTSCPGQTNSLQVLSKPDCMEKTNTTEINDTSYQGETDPPELPSELDGIDKAIDQSTETTNMYGEEVYIKISRQFEDRPLTSSPDILTSTLSSIERVEDSDGIEDRGKQSSPVSVLEQFFVDAAKTANTISEPAEEHHPAPFGRSSLDPETETSSLNEHEYISEYVRGVLQASGLNWDQFTMMRHSSDQLLDPFLLDAVKLQASQFHGDCMLLFECINEFLVEAYHTHLPCSPWVSFIEPNVTRHLCIEKTVIHEVMKYVDGHLLLHPSPGTLQQVVEKDIEWSGKWLDIRNDAEEIVFEMVEDVLEELIMETIF